MSIEEAFGRYDPTRAVSCADRYNRNKENREAMLTRGRELLEEAGIPSLLYELRDYLVVDFPDAEVVHKYDAASHFGIPTALGRCHDRGVLYELDKTGVTKAEIRWDLYSSSVRDGYAQGYNCIVIEVNPVNGNIAVIGQQVEVVGSEEWRSEDGRKALEDALVSAYKNPLEYSNESEVI